METASRSVMKSIAASADSANKSVLAQVGWILAFAVLCAIGAQIQIPHEPVPYTLQTFFVLLGGAFLGSRNGSASQLLYLAAGVAGAPVFAGASAGVLCLLGPSGGYLMSFPVAACLVGYLVQRRSGFFWTFLAMFLGLLVIFASGAGYLHFTYFHNVKQSIMSGFLIFSWWDMLKLSAAAAIYSEFAKKYRSLPNR
jgi:biotin transport system substrate-specific component